MTGFSRLKIQPILGLLCLLMVISPAATASESRHWVCDSEALYRKLVSAQLYGVGSPPKEGCTRLPTQVQIEQLRCETSDITICVYRWSSQGISKDGWGSPIITSIPTNRN